MSFPVSYSETFVLKKTKYRTGARNLVHAILKYLQKTQATKVKSVANSIYFNNGFDMLDRWGLLFTVRSGTILVQEEKAEIYITYRLKFHKPILYTTFSAAVLFGMLLINRTSYQYLETIKFILVTWLLFFGGSYLFTIFRFPFFIKRAINSKT